MTLETRRTAQRERRSRKRLQRQNSAVIEAVQPLVNKLPLNQVLDDEGIAAIHKASMCWWNPMTFLCKSVIWTCS